MMAGRAGILALLVAGLGAAAAVAQPAVVQPGMVAGRWAVSPARCDTEALSFAADGTFTSTLDGQAERSGKYRTARDRIILVDAEEPDRELALILIDLSPTRLVAFDETVEADRRLVKCR